MAAQSGAARPDQPPRGRGVTAMRSTATPASSASPAPLSVAQEALWYRALLAPTALTYNEAISFRRDGPLDADALRLALKEIVRRHEAWRTTFDTVDGEPVQVVGPAPIFELPVLDLSDLSSEQAERRAVELVAETARVPYDVRHGPLLRPRLIRFASDHHRLYLAMHHLIFDGVSLTRIVLPELATLYEAFSAGRSSPLAETPLSYADYARWEQAWMEQPRAQRRLAYWEGRLDDAPAFSLAVDHLRPSTARSRGGAVELSISADTVHRLREIGRQAGGTLFQALAATWSLLQSRYTGQQDVVFAVAADMRQRPEFELLVGCGLTPLAVRLDLGGDPSFVELVVRVRNDLLDGLHNVLPFERLVRALHPEASGANPIYQTMLVLEPAAEATDPAWSVHQIDSPLADAVGASKLDLELQLDERPAGELVGQLIYDRDLFERATAVRLRGHWLRLVDQVASDPAAPISRLAILTPAEEHRQLIEWNATRTELRAAPVHDLIRECALRQPRAVAVSDGTHRLDYGELELRAQETADRLTGGSALSSDVQTLGGEPSVELVVRALGALKAGAVLRWRDGGSRDGEPVAAREPAAVCGVLQAAGGRPVAVTHAAAVNLARALAARLGIGPADTVLVLPRTLASDPIAALWMGLIAGARIVLAPAEVAAEGSRLRRLIGAEEVTLLQAWPSEWQSLIDTGLTSVRGLRALSGGAPLSRQLAGQILERCRVLWNAYGRAETSGYCTLAAVQTDEPVTIGRPLANTRAYVLDRHDRPVPVGAPGELVIAGEGVVAGYLDDGGDAGFIRDPFASGRALRTGERARWRPDGQLELAT